MSWGVGWGLTPWGGFLVPGIAPPPAPPADFDLFVFYHPSTMAGILSDPSVSASPPASFAISAYSDLCVSSGGSVPAVDALLTISSTVPETWTAQFTLLAHTLPPDFSDLVHSHVYFGVADSSGLAAGLFVSSAGIAYAGAITLASGDLVLAGPFQVIPGTAGLVELEEYFTLRLAVDSVTSTTYVFVTRTSDIAYTGHRLVAILPGIATGGVVADGATISVRGTDAHPSWVCFDMVGLGTGLIMPNAPPRADAGRDQSLRLCSVGLLDGSASVDPEGGSLTYSWRLIDAPPNSAFAFEGADGFTVPLPSPSGYTNTFHSSQLGDESLLDPVAFGDVLLIGGLAYSILEAGVDGFGFYVRVTSNAFADSLAYAPFKLLRQRFITNATSVHPTFYPDIPGIYKFDLSVFDGQYLSSPSPVIVNVMESQVPKGCIPDLGFLWQYLSDFWKLVEDRERIQVMWESMAQVAAAELLSLWQVDYSKSLRDVQRAFQRRWLHYDLRLPEPLPDLTVLRRVYGGITTRAAIDSALGVFGVLNTVLVIESPVHDPVRITFQLADPYTATMLQSVLQVKLQGVDSRYSVVVIGAGPGLQHVRVVAPFYFTVNPTSTTSVFLGGSSNVAPSGTGGLRLTPRTYQVDRSLQGLDLAEGDFLVVGGEGYEISRVVDDPLDPLRYQRVVVKVDLPMVPGATWSISSCVTSRLLNFYDGMVTAGDVAVFEVLDSTSTGLVLLSAPVLAACAAKLTSLCVDLSQVDQYLSIPTVSTRLAYVLRKTRLPIGALVTDIPCLQEHIRAADDGAVLRRNVDYFLETYRGGNSIRFVAGNSWDTGDVWEGVPPPDRLWAEVTYFDNRPIIEANFGIPAEFTLDQLAEMDTDLDYLSAVRGLWYSYLNGPTMFNLRVGSQILLGLPFAEEAGVIEEIRQDFSPTQGRILVRDAANTAIVRAYSFPRPLGLETSPSTGVAYVVGDSVTQLAPLVQGSEVVDYVKDPTWFQGVLSQGSFFEVEKFHKFMVRVDSSAFSLSSLMFVRSFILRVKPSYTFPLFVVRVAPSDTTVSVSDVMVARGKLVLNEGGVFSALGYSTVFDDYRAAGGGVRNQFDSNGDPDDAAPVFPTADAVVPWGFDKDYLCPEDYITASWGVDHPGGAVPFDSVFRFDGGNFQALPYSATGVTSVPAVGYTFGTTRTVGAAGNVTAVRVVIQGSAVVTSPYVLVLTVSTVPVGSCIVNVPVGGMTAEVPLAVPAPLGAGDVVAMYMYPYDAVDHVVDWVYVSFTWLMGDIPFQFDNGVPAGTYYVTRVL